MRIKNEDLLVTSGAISLASSTSLQPTWLGHIVLFSVQLVVTGTPAGTFKLQVSNDPGHIDSAGTTMQTSGVTNWSDIGVSSTISSAGTTWLEVKDITAEWVRVVWTASGAGSTPVLTSARAKIKGV